MGRQKRDVPTGKMRLKYPKTGYDTSKEYTLYYEYNWNREIIRRDSGFRVKVTDWNQSAANGRGEFRVSYGDEAKRCNKLITSVLQQTDASLKEYSIKHPGIMTAEIVRSILFNKPLTRDDEGQDFIEYVINNLKVRLNANKIGISRYENGVSGMKIFREFLVIKSRGTYKPDSIYLGEISGKLIDEYIDFRRNIKKNEATTINHSLTPIILACENAKMRGYIKESVYAEIKDKRLVEPATSSTEDGFDGKYLRPEEIQKLIDFYEHDTEPRRKEYIEMFLFAFHAGGLRLVDVMTLQWKHINFETKEMKKILIKTSKTQKQRHTVPLTPSAIAILEKWKAMGRRAKFVFDLLPSDDIDVTVESEIYGRRNSVDCR